MTATLRFVNAVASLPGVRLGLVSQAPLASLPAVVRRRIAGHYQVRDALDAGQLARAVKFLAKQRAFGGPAGGVDRLLGALEQLQVPLGKVREHLGIEGMGARAAMNFRDKGRMKTVLRTAGLPCARHATADSRERARAAVESFGYPVVIKPPDGAAAVATYRVQSVDELRRVLRSVRPRPSRPVVIEEFITGRENSLETVCVRGQAVWDSYTRYNPAPLHVLENPWIQWTVLLPREPDNADTAAIRAPGRAALSALGMYTGLSHMEWFHTDRGAVISEVAARPPGAQIIPLNSYAHETDFYHLWARLLVFDEWRAPARKFATGAAFFRGQRLRKSGEAPGPGRIVAIHGLERAQREIGDLVVEANLPRLGASKRTTYEGDGYAILRHKDTEVVERALARLVALVQVEVV